MVFVPLLAGAFALQASAFPFVMNEVASRSILEARTNPTAPGPSAAVAASKARKNCGVVPCTIFNADEQFVSTSGKHAYKKPSATDIRGPCPGLNAAANHGYLPRNGVPTIQDTITGLGAAYGMTADLGGVLAVLAVVLDGDIAEQSWSIGGPPPQDPLTAGLLGKPTGISYSHNNYENDASIGRADAYLNHGDAHSLIVERFIKAYKAHDGNGLYNLDLFAQNYADKAYGSIRQNPYAFWGPFSGLVAPAAYNFVINFMSNHTAENPNGYLDASMFKTFFAITGDSPKDFKWIRGQERIPENWYRRPLSQGYNAVSVFEDLGAQFLAYPNSALIGGNTGKVNTFTGVDLGNLTGGVINGENLLKGNNLGCFFFQAASAGLPASATLGSKAKKITGLFEQFLDPVIKQLGCPQIAKWDNSVFEAFPGYKYHPTGPAQNY